MRINKYIVYTLICIIGIIVLNTISLPPPEIAKPAQITFNPDLLKNTLRSPQFLVVLLVHLLVFFVIFAGGLASIIFFAINKSKGKPLLGFAEPVKPFPLSKENASKLLFTLVLLTFFLYLAETAIMLIAPNKNDLITIFIALNLVLEIGTILIILYSLFYRKTFIDFRMEKRHSIAALTLYAATVPFIILATLLNTFVLEKMGLQSSLNPVIALVLILKRPSAMAMLLMQIVIVGPIAEELLFRNFLYPALRKKYAVLPSAIIVSFAFALLHKVPHNILPLSIISIALCYLYEKTQTITAPILFHIIFNTLNISSLLILKDLILT